MAPHLVEPLRPFAVYVRTDSAVLTVRIEGDLDFAHRLEVLGAIDSEPVPRVVRFDMAAVHYVDSAGMATILHAIKRVKAVGGAVVVRAPSPNLLELLRNTGIDQRVTIEPA